MPKKTITTKGDIDFANLVVNDVFDSAEGRFSNMVRVVYNGREVFLDFCIMTPPDSSNIKGDITRLLSRIILTKEHLKDLSQVIADTAKQLENE